MLVYPELIGQPAARFFVSGPRVLFERFEPILRCIAPDSVYAGEQVGSACAQESALMAFVLGAYIGYIHGLRLCNAEGLDAPDYTERMVNVSARMGSELRALGSRIAKAQFGDTRAPLHTYQSAARILAEHAQELNLEAMFPSCANALLSRAMDAGFGPQDFASLIKV